MTFSDSKTSIVENTTSAQFRVHCTSKLFNPYRFIHKINFVIFTSILRRTRAVQI